MKKMVTIGMTLAVRGSAAQKGNQQPGNDVYKGFGGVI